MDGEDKVGNCNRLIDRTKALFYQVDGRPSGIPSGLVGKLSEVPPSMVGKWN
jgi:hypothetical protein